MISIGFSLIENFIIPLVILIHDQPVFLNATALKGYNEIDSHSGSGDGNDFLDLKIGITIALRNEIPIIASSEQSGPFFPERAIQITQDGAGFASL
jgi:hypothetical protein